MENPMSNEQNKPGTTPATEALKTGTANVAQQTVTAAPSVPTASTTAVPQLDPNALMALVQLLLAQQQDAMQDKAEKARAREARDKQHRLNSQHNEKDEKQKQAMCTHRKGGKTGPKSNLIDYAVYMHRFVDESIYIRCLICGMKWKPNDTQEYLVRRGQKVANHTGLSWKDASLFLQNSTNKNSASEVLRDSNQGPVVPDYSDPTTIEI
jgi:hypothetical protein